MKKKLRIISGLEGNPLDNLIEQNEKIKKEVEKNKQTYRPEPVLYPESLNIKESFEQMESSHRFEELKSLYNKKIASNLGMKTRNKLSDNLSQFFAQGFDLSVLYATFDFQFEKLNSFLSNLEGDLHELDQHLLDKKSLLRSTPSIIPVNGWITSYFGERKSPYSKRNKMHEGLDIGAPYGTPILASAGGVVTFSGIKSSFGKFIRIDHGYGIETLYAHSKKLNVKKGQVIKRGDLIAFVGSSGYSTGPHLHYEVRLNGVAVDPINFILEE